MGDLQNLGHDGMCALRDRNKDCLWQIDNTFLKFSSTNWQYYPCDKYKYKYNWIGSCRDKALMDACRVKEIPFVWMSTTAQHPTMPWLSEHTTTRQQECTITITSATATDHRSEIILDHKSQWWSHAYGHMLRNNANGDVRWRCRRSGVSDTWLLPFGFYRIFDFRFSILIFDFRF